MGGDIKIRERYRNPIKANNQRKPEFIKTPSKPIKILLAHDNRLDYYTDKAHRFGEWLNEKKEFEVIIDKDYWKRGERTSETETDKREREMVKGADIIVRLIHSPSKSGEPRHEGPHREIRKAINVGKPVIEIFYIGAKDTPNRPLNERNYKFRIPIYIKRGESLENALNRGLDELYNRRNP